jgi:NAD(P)-dependent dehydrogenase (short-subunit alcohol dehydrogenase family)
LNRLRDKVILVTGSGRGFGRAMSYAYALEGADVVITARTISELETLKSTILKAGGSCLMIPADISNYDEIKKISNLVSHEFGRLDVLVNNAATSPWKTFSETSIVDWDQVIAVNLRAPFLLSKEFFTMMKKTGHGSIINITSASAQMGFVAEIGYCPSKYGLEGLTQCLAMELYEHNIAVNSLGVAAPKGKRLKPTELTLMEASNMPEEVQNFYADDKSMAEAFSDAWVFLALQDARGVTGQRIGSSQLSEFIRTKGWDAAVQNWKEKFTKAVYTPYDMPKMVRYQTPEGGFKELHFRI